MKYKKHEQRGYYDASKETWRHFNTIIWKQTDWRNARKKELKQNRKNTQKHREEKHDLKKCKHDMKEKFCQETERLMDHKIEISNKITVQNHNPVVWQEKQLPK